MIQYHITVTSKNKNSIKNFFIFFDRIFESFNIIRKYLKKKRKRKIVTILKSPHVNKTAQEHFETRLYTSQITVYYSQKYFKILIFLKKIKIYLFPDIKIKIKFTVNKLSMKKTQTKILNPDNFKLNFFNKQLKNNNLKNIKHYKSKQYNKEKNILLKKTEYFLKILDTYGNLIKHV
jgi:ribosomal protein S10